ncbi:hypothetical protein E2C01_031673 [Portunus trituberculatus]|uniref:Uncharacterized protein n=1 Tax=Portunus trituberculatus TaxID=210409 RepID=A0A5B7EYR6_PORTR|nr:hypothetical protein [Portunus trituberculatus]
MRQGEAAAQCKGELGVWRVSVRACLEEGLGTRHLAARSSQQDAAGLQVSCRRDRHRHVRELLLQLPDGDAAVAHHVTPLVGRHCHPGLDHLRLVQQALQVRHGCGDLPRGAAHLDGGGDGVLGGRHRHSHPSKLLVDLLEGSAARPDNAAPHGRRHRHRDLRRLLLPRAAHAVERALLGGPFLPLPVRRCPSLGGTRSLLINGRLPLRQGGQCLHLLVPSLLPAADYCPALCGVLQDLAGQVRHACHDGGRLHLFFLLLLVLFSLSGH